MFLIVCGPDHNFFSTRGSPAPPAPPAMLPLLLLLVALVATAAAPPPPTLPGGIPKLIHQSWKTPAVPPAFARWRASWARHHPTWTVTLWTDADNRALVLNEYPWFLDTYDALPKPVMRADAARLLYMHARGGVYVDLDFKALRPLDGVLANVSGAVVAAMTDADWDQALPNAFLASPPAHPFWLFALHHVVKMAGGYALHGRARCAVPPRWDWLEATTGPAVLHAAAAAYRAAGQTGLTILAPGVVYPIDWRDTQWGPGPGKAGDAFSVCRADHPAWSEAACDARFPGAVAITYWSHVWGPSMSRRRGRRRRGG